MPLTTDEAFETLVNSDYYWSLTGLSHEQKRTNRHRVNSGQTISAEKKEELLRRAGFGRQQVTTWSLPGSRQPSGTKPHKAPILDT